MYIPSIALLLTSLALSAPAHAQQLTTLGEAKGIWLNDVPVADIYFDSEDFMFDLASKQTLTHYHDRAEVMSIDLTATMLGLEEVLICQDAQV